MKCGSTAYTKFSAGLTVKLSEIATFEYLQNVRAIIQGIIYWTFSSDQVVTITFPSIYPLLPVIRQKTESDKNQPKKFCHKFV